MGGADRHHHRCGLEKKREDRFNWEVSTSRLLNTHLIGLNEVEVLPVNSIAMFKVSTLLLTPATQLFYREGKTHAEYFQFHV